MVKNRQRLLYLALAVADSSWVFAASAAFGSLVALNGSALAWPIVLGLLLGAIAVAWVAVGVRGDFVTVAMLQAGLGLVAVYAALALRSAESVQGTEWSWPFRLFRGQMEADGVGSAIIALLLSLYLWRRGMRIVAEHEPWDSLHASFRRGIAVIAIALLIEIITGRQSGVRLIVFPFFAASLAGMALGRLAEPEAGKSGLGAWGRVIGGTIVGVLGSGLILGLLGSSYGSGPVHAIGSMLAGVRDALLWLLSFPLRYVFMAVWAFFSWLRSLFGKPEQVELQLQPGISKIIPTETAQAAEKMGPSLWDAVMNVLVYVLMAVLFAVIFYILLRGFRRMLRRAGPGVEPERDSIRGDADPGKDLLNLLGRLLPRIRRSGKKAPRMLRYPVGQPGISEVFVLYFRYLTAAFNHGAPLDPHLTPNELRGRLEEALPGTPVRLMTERFNAACYGHEPSPPEVIDRLRHGLGELGPAPGR